MTSAKKSTEVLKESLKKAQEKAAAIRKELKATEQAERAKRALGYWKVIHDTAEAKGVEIPTPEQVKKILIKSFKEATEETPPKAAGKKPSAKRSSVKKTSALRSQTNEPSTNEKRDGK